MKVIYIETKKHYTVHLKPFEAYDFVNEHYAPRDRELQYTYNNVIYSTQVVPKYTILYNDVPIPLDKNRFISLKEYRKLKLKKNTKWNIT